MRILHSGRIKYFLVIASILIPAAIVTGCSSDDGTSTDGDPDGSGRADSGHVMATTPIWADIIGSVTCDRVDVEPIAPPGSDSHDFELSMRAADRLLGSRIVFANGLELETDLAPMFDRAEKSNIAVVLLGESLPSGLPPIDGDPHIWTDPQSVAALVPVIESELASVDVMDRDELAECAAQYVGRLDELTTTMSQTLSVIPPARRKLVGEHRNLGYFARQFDFEVLGAMIDSHSSLAEADTRHLDSLREQMRRQDVDTVIIDSADNDAAARAFVADVSPAGRVVKLYIETMPSGDGDDGYIAMMRTNAERVAEALAG